MVLSYHHERCDLCGSTAYTVLYDRATGRAMTSDSRVIAAHLQKWSCDCCGLVRSGPLFAALDDYYAHDYTLNTSPVDHIFHTHQGPLSRSALLAEWFAQAFGAHPWRAAQRALEVGAGAGWLLRQLTARFPHITIEGIELSAEAARLAQQEGLSVAHQRLEEHAGGDYDIIYAMGVLEHVPSPRDFLGNLRQKLRPNGWLYLCQPTQDVPSYDVFFIDHLHHFSSEHLRHYARLCGFREVGLAIGHEWVPNFSLHLWQADGQPIDTPWSGPPLQTTCAHTITAIQNAMARLDAHLDRLEAQGARYAVFGLSEVYALVSANSRLGEGRIVCGLDDVVDKPAYAQLGFPVITPQQAPEYGITDVILTMNPVYYPRVIPRLKALGLRAYAVLDAP